jgi:hypothetical protein
MRIAFRPQWAVASMLWAVVVFFMAACAAEPVPAVGLVTRTPTLTITPSISPVWFPATETPTPVPTVTPRPTEEYKPGVGEKVVGDDFSKIGGWRTAATENGRIAYGKQELTLAVSGVKGVLFSLRTGALPADAYLEITVTPAICQAGDIYGILLRAASERDGYRLMATCAGRLRMERLRNGEIALMQDWTPSGELPQGGLLPVRLGVWSHGTELRVFVNGVYQFGVRDPVFESGQIGAYARAAADTPLTVSFSDLAVYQLDLARIPTATPRATPTP